MQLLDSWKDITYNFADPVIWQGRKERLCISDDQDFERFLSQLYNRGMNEKESSFLHCLLDVNRLISKGSILSMARKSPSPIDHVLTALPQYLLQHYEQTFATCFPVSAFPHWDRRRLSSQVRDCLTNMLRAFIRPTATYEYFVFLKAYEREDDADAQLYFVSEIASSRDWIMYFFESYPVLLSLLTSFSTYFMGDIDRVLHRLHEDLDEIRSQFGIPGHIPLHTIQFYLGDPHKGWQSTALFRFGKLYDVYYKPRSLSGDIFFADLINHLCSLGLEKSVLPTKVIDKRTYGWQEGVHYMHYTDEARLPDFFYKQGINAALAYVFNIQDLIADNIMVSHDLPVFFDLEMILLPQWKGGKDYKTRSKAGRELIEGVIKTGLVPSYGFETVNNPGYSNSGLCKVSDHAYKVFVARDNKITLAPYRVKASDTNLPVFEGKVVQVNKYCDRFEAGFKNGCAFLMKYKRNILDYVARSMETIDTIQSRILIRLTYSYSGLLNESYYPLYMSNYYEYHKLLELLWRGHDAIFVTEGIIQSEIDQLLRNEVPYFYARPSSKDLYDSDGNILAKNYFRLSGIDCMIHRIADLNGDAVTQQVNIIRRAFYIHNDQSLSVEHTYPYSPRDFKNQRELANEIGHFLFSLNRSGPGENYFSYIDYTLTKDDLWSQGIQNCDIFQGTEGLGIFFMAMYATYGDSRYLTAARHIFDQSIEMFTRNRNWFLDNPKNRIGLTAFPVSTLYYMLLGNRILQKEHFSIPDEQLSTFLGYIQTNYPSDDCFCYFFGSTGSILVLLELYRIRQDPVIYRLILQLGDHLVERACAVKKGMISWEKPFFDKWGGVSHGNSFIAYALFRIAGLSKQERFYDCAVQALQYDQSLFDPVRKIWRKSIDFEGDIHHSWGNGSAGIGLSRQLISPYYTNELMSMEEAVAIENIDTCLPGIGQSDHSICSGLLGMLELRKQLDPGYDHRGNMEAYITGLHSIYAIKSGGWEKNPLVTGLYYGLAGVGYNLLKLTDNPGLPSLLWL